MTEEEQREYLKGIVPIFGISKVKVFWSGTVNKIGQSNNLSKRLFVIASPGVFLIHQRSFQFQTHLVAAISFYELNTISLAKNNVTFSGKSTQIRIRSEFAKQIATEAFIIRQALFPTDLLPFNFNISGETGFETVSMKPISLDTIFLDRTLSCIYYLCPNFSKVNESLLSYVTDTVPKTLVIDQSFLECPSLQPIILSLAYEQDLEHLKFVGVRLADFFSISNIFIRVNRFIKHVTLENVDFSDPEKKLKSTLLKKHAFRPNWWTFDNCNLTTQDFHTFFENISLFGSKITSLEVKKCIAGDMISFFQTIFFDECFHSLQMISITAVENPSYLTTHIIELAGCSWALEKKCLHKIIVNSCDIDGAFLLEQLLRFDFGLQYIDLSSNNCEAPLQDHQGRLSYIGLSDCRTTSQFLCSLFKTMDTGLSVVNLDISSIRIEPSELVSFLNTVKSYKLPITSLNASGIEMKSANTKLFAEFLSNQVNLKELSIDDSINISDSPEGLQALSAVLQKLSIKKLSIACSGQIDKRCSSLLIPIIQGMKELKSLDVTNQGIGAAGFSAIVPLLDQFDELFFDGSWAPLDAIIDFCNKCLESRLKYSRFPTDDIKMCFSAVQKPANYTESQEQIKVLMEKFEERFRGESIKPAQIFIEPARSRKRVTRTVSTVFQAKSTDDYSILYQRSHELEEMYRECVGEDACEPILAIVEGLEESVSLSKLAMDL